MDRSIYGDAIFAQQNVDDGNINQIGYDNYMKMRDVMLLSYDTSSDTFENSAKLALKVDKETEVVNK